MVLKNLFVLLHFKIEAKSKFVGYIQGIPKNMSVCKKETHLINGHFFLGHLVHVAISYKSFRRAASELNQDRLLFKDLYKQDPKSNRYDSILQWLRTEE